jgi:hypothetical protein
MEKEKLTLVQGMKTGEFNGREMLASQYQNQNGDLIWRFAVWSERTIDIRRYDVDDDGTLVSETHASAERTGDLSAIKKACAEWRLPDGY